MIHQVRFAVAFACLLSLTTTAQAEIYKWTDADGNTHYSQAPPSDQKAEDIGLQIELAAGSASKAKSTDGEEKQNDDSDNKKGLANKTANKRVNQTAFCDQQKATLEQLQANTSIRWKSETEDKVLTEDERQTKIAEFKTNIDKICKPKSADSKDKINTQ